MWKWFIFATKLTLKDLWQQKQQAYLWSEKWSCPSALRVPADANMMVVSRSPMIPLTVLAAWIHAWVPREPACNVPNTFDTCQHQPHFTKPVLSINVVLFSGYFLILFIFYLKKNHCAPVSQVNWCNMTFTAGNLFPSHSCIGWPKSSPHRDSNPGPQL